DARQVKPFGSDAPPKNFDLSRHTKGAASPGVQTKTLRKRPGPMVPIYLISNLICLTPDLSYACFYFVYNPFREYGAFSSSIKKTISESSFLLRVSCSPFMMMESPSYTVSPSSPSIVALPLNR